MDKRRKWKLEQDLERYSVPLKLVMDQRAVAALNQLIKETAGRLYEINNCEQRDPYENTDSRDGRPGDQMGLRWSERV
jgi:hypothetical protein